MKIPFIPWMNILNSKVKFWHMIWIDTWELSDTCFFSLLFQKVTLNKIGFNYNSSDWVRLTCGVPQASILGPLLFLIYINDLPTLINKDNNIVLFADDTSVIITDTDRDDFTRNVNKLFKNINNWIKKKKHII